MTCDESINLLSARLDGELPTADSARLDAHLAECADCRAMAAALAVQDELLTAAVAPHRAAAAAIADRVILELASASAPPAAPKELAPAKRWRLSWVVPITSAAAGFLIACLWLQPWRRPEVATTPGPRPATRLTPAVPVAKLALATGAVFVCPSSDNPATDASWCAMPTGGSIREGDRVRTGSAVRCEFKTADGSEVRLNADTEVCFRKSRAVDLAGGQLWSTVAKSSEPFEAHALDATFTALGTQFDLAAKAERAVLTVVEGSVRAKGASGEQVVNGGEGLTVEAGRLGDKTGVQNLAVATRWVNEILVMKGRDNPELAARVDDLFADIGQQKMSFLYEEEIRALGDHCVIPLARYIESDRSRGSPAKRAEAAKIIADVAPTWAIPELIRLLEDDKGEVRYYAASALRRLTGQSFGRSPEQWRADSQMACLPVANEWRAWWERNKERFPGADSSPLKVPPPAVAKEQAPAKKG